MKNNPQLGKFQNRAVSNSYSKANGFLRKGVLKNVLEIGNCRYRTIVRQFMALKKQKKTRTKTRPHYCLCSMVSFFSNTEVVNEVSVPYGFLPAINTLRNDTSKI